MLAPLVQLVFVADVAPRVADFRPFTPTHYVTAGFYALAMSALVAAGLALRGSLRANQLQRGWFWFVLAVQTFNIIFWSTPPRLELASSLPLHICDLAGILAVFATWSWTRQNSVADQTSGFTRTLATIMFFWGLGLSTQAFFTPVISQGPDTVRFHIFFLSHFTIVATPLYDFIVRGYRPAWRDLGVIVLITAIFGAVMIPLNTVTGWNYGYVGTASPDNPTLIDKLGPYPLRLLWLAGIITTVYTALTLMAMLIPQRAR